MTNVQNRPRGWHDRDWPLSDQAMRLLREAAGQSVNVRRGRRGGR